MIVYLESSAAVKLVKDEHASEDLRSWLDARDVVASDLVRLEVTRAALRAGSIEDPRTTVDRCLTAVVFVRIDELVINRARTAGTAHLRSLDAIHLATAQRLGSELGAFVTYDLRLAEAAREAGMRVESPGV